MEYAAFILGFLITALLVVVGGALYTLNDASVCICDDADNCTCGAWGRRK